MSRQRADWDSVGLAVARVFSMRAPCPRGRVGAAIIHPETRAVLGAGYNAPPRGTATPDKLHCIRTVRKIPSGEQPGESCCVHAEANAITLAAVHSTSVRGADIYCTRAPCERCAALIVNAHLGRVVVPYGTPPPSEEAREVLARGGVIWQQAAEAITVS